MKNIIVGTAGHIDHGKSALVRALTGIEPDRLAEEQRRGISIDLGFAHLDLTPELRIGFVDVPGHERFVRNMLAGAGGIDLVLLVIAADESIKPQTREHFDICRLLGIERGIVVLTKADLVDPELVELVRLEAAEFVSGSFLEGAPIVAVSAKTGAGLDELRSALVQVSQKAKAKDSSRHFRLPVDRSFSMRGFGTVITGTLVSGEVAVDDELELHPAGMRLRVRGLQTHGAEAKRARAGQRTAVNLSGIEAEHVRRGMTLTRPGTFRAARIVDCLLDLLPSAKALKHGAPVHFHAGTAETEARVRALDPPDAVRPGTTGIVRLELREPVLLLPGDRFIVRMFSPVVTIGGGIVVDIDPPRRRRRVEAAARIRALAASEPRERIEQLAAEQAGGMSVADVVARTGLLEAEVKRTESRQLQMLAGPPPWIVSRTWLEERQTAIAARLKAFHRDQPLLAGAPKEEIRSREMAGTPGFVLDALLKDARTLVVEGDLVRLASHKIQYRQDEEEALAKIEGAFERGGMSVPATSEVLAASGVEPARARSLLQILLRQKRLIRVSEDLVYHDTAIASLRSAMASRKGQRFSVAMFKDWTGVSRKYAIPLLEFLDRERVTRREGDERVVL